MAERGVSGIPSPEVIAKLDRVQPQPGKTGTLPSPGIDSTDEILLYFKRLDDELQQSLLRLVKDIIRIQEETANKPGKGGNDEAGSH